MKKVTAIICVYNEEETVRNVVQSVANEPIVGEIIIVNDGSTDNTDKILNELSEQVDFVYITYHDNKGKGYAMALGAEAASNDIIAYIDADQTKIIEGYIEEMATPLFNKETDMVLGYTTVNILNQEINPMKILTGERTLYKADIMPIIDKIKESRFGVETLLYFYYLSICKTMKFLPLVGLKHRDKYKKTTITQATSDYLHEGWEIAYTAMKNYDMMLKSIKNSFTKRA